MRIVHGSGLAFVAVLLVACSGPAGSVPPTATTSSPGSPPLPALPTPVPSLRAWCEEGASDCSALRDAALGVVAGAGHTPVRVWVSSGVLCPVADDCLFNPDANFPAPTIPKPGAGDGELLAASGSAEIAFADTDLHAGINFFPDGETIIPELVGYRVPDRAWCSGYCPTAGADEGLFRLELVAPHLDWRAGEPIVGTQALLEYGGSAPTNVYGAQDVIAFGYAEVGGTRTFGPASDASCQATPLDPATALSVPLGKSGGYNPDNPDDAWIPAFLSADGVRLPAGTWNVTAYAQFGTDPGCLGHHTMRVTLQLTVGG